MKVLLFVTFTLLVALGQSAQNICAPPKFTSIGQMAVSKLSYGLHDYEKGLVFLTDKDDKFGDRWIMMDITNNRIYSQETEQPCVFTEMKPGFKESFNQCLPEDAEEIGNVFGWKMYMTLREEFSSIIVVKPVLDSPYFVWYISTYGPTDEIDEFMVAKDHIIGIEEPSLLEKDLSVCVQA